MALGRLRALQATSNAQSKRWLHCSRTAFQQSPPQSGGSDDANGDGMIRLAKLMAQRGLCSRREADAYIQAGNVLVNGEKMQADWLKVPVDSDVQLDFRAQRHQNKKVTIVLNKPLGVVSSQPEDNHTPAVKLLTFANECREMNKVRPRQQEEPINLWKMAVCGRLDVNSTGVLLFTQDGACCIALCNLCNAMVASA